MIALINTGCANLNSVKFAFERTNQPIEIVNDPAKLKQYSRAVLPGVGHAKAAMQRLCASGWDQAIREYDNPLLGICLGMQLLCEHTEEGDINGLGVIPGRLVELKSNTKPLPHMGWNTLSFANDHPILTGIKSESYIYYVHSFAHEVNAASIATSEYEQRFSAIIAKDNYLGMQFHPERSAQLGATLLSNFTQWNPS